MNEWQPIETAKTGETVVLWAPVWRHPWCGMVNGDFGACYLDGFQHGDGWQTFATHWKPISVPAQYANKNAMSSPPGSQG